MPNNISVQVVVSAESVITLPMMETVFGQAVDVQSVITFALPYNNITVRLGGYTPHVGIGSDLIYPEASGLEKAMADVDAERVTAIDAELIQDIWDPYNCPYDLLPYLAWAMGVNFWNDDWSETTKRDWVASQWEFKSMRGTADGMAMVIDYAGRDVSPFGYELLSVITQPQGTYPGPAVTYEEHLAWLEGLPQLRVYLFNTPGTAQKYKAFAGSSWKPNDAPNFYLNTTYLIPSVAKEQLGYDAVYYPQGANGPPDTDAVAVDLGSYYQVKLPGEADARFFLNNCFLGAGTGKFMQPSDAWKRIFTIEPDFTQPHPIAVGPSFNAISAAPILVTVPGEKGLGVYSGSRYYFGGGTYLAAHDAAPTPYSSYLIPSNARYQIYHEYAIFDPDDPPPGVAASAVSAFTNMTYLGWPDYTAQANVFVASEKPTTASYLGDGIYLSSGSYLIPHDPGPVNTVIAAIEASRRMSDKVLLNTAPPPVFVAGAQFIAGQDQLIVGQLSEGVPVSPYKPVP